MHAPAKFPCWTATYWCPLNCSCTPSPVERSLDISNPSYAHLLYRYSYDRIGQDFFVFHLANQFISQILVLWILNSFYSLEASVTFVVESVTDLYGKQ